MTIDDIARSSIVVGRRGSKQENRTLNDATPRTGERGVRNREEEFEGNHHPGISSDHTSTSVIPPQLLM